MSEHAHGLREDPSRRDPCSEAASSQSGCWLTADFRADCETPPAQLSGLLFGLSPDRWLRRIPGRETFSWPGREAWIVKRIAGGERRDYWQDRLRGVRRSAARREAENQRLLEEDGFHVPRPLAWVEEESARGHPRRAGRSALVMERVPFSMTLRERLAEASAPDRGRLLARLARWVSALHDAGWIHRDLYLQHVVLVGRGEELVLLDVGRARKRAASGNSGGAPQRTRWLVKDLAALHFSAPENVSRSERLRFLSNWISGCDLRRRRVRLDRRHLASQILKRARRMATHRPVHLDPADAMDAQFFAR